MVSLLLSHSVCVCVRVVCLCVWERARERECDGARESAHNRLTFFGHITNLFIYFTTPLRWASVFPEECAHSKAILIRTPSQLQLLTSVLGIFAHFGLHSVPHICSMLLNWEQVPSITYCIYISSHPPSVDISSPKCADMEMHHKYFLFTQNLQTEWKCFAWTHTE